VGFFVSIYHSLHVYSVADSGPNMNAKTLNGSVHLVDTYISILSECEQVIKFAETITTDESNKKYFSKCAGEVSKVVEKSKYMTKEFKRLAKRCS